MSEPLQELFSRILAAFIDSELSLRFPKGTSTGDSSVDIITSKINRGKWTKGFSDNIEETTLSSARKWELRALLQLLKRQKGKLLLLAVSNLHLYTPDGKRKVEWDGVFFNIEKDNIILYILEAKRNISRRSKECSSALLDSINKAGIRPKQGKLPMFRRQGYAYTKIALADIILSTLL